MTMQETNATNIEVVALSDVRDDPAWVTDEAKVEGLRAVLRAHKQFPTPVMRRVWAADGSFHYTIIDGFHRIRALVAEGVASYPMMVGEWDEREAEYDRISASLDKPSPVLHSRAVTMLRRSFVRDMLNMVKDQQLLTVRLGDDGERQVIERQGPLPAEPIMALLVIRNHFLAAGYKRPLAFDLGQQQPQPDMSEWARTYDAWCIDLGARFGFSRRWLDEVLETSFLLDRMSDIVQVLDMGDEEIQQIVISRLQNEKTQHTYHKGGVLSDALHYCFPALQLGRNNDFLRKRSRKESIKLWAANTIPQLNAMHDQEREASYRREQAARDATREQRWREEAEAREAREAKRQAKRQGAVFAVAPQRVAPGHAAPVVPAPPTPQAVAAPRPIVANYAPCLDAATMLFDEWTAYEANGGNWQARDVQAHLQRILAYVQERIKAN